MRVEHGFVRTRAGGAPHFLDFGGSGKTAVGLHGVTGHSWAWHDVAAELRRDVETEDVVLISDRDRREPAGAEPLLQHRIDGRVRGLHHHNAVLANKLQRPVISRHDDADLRALRLPESPHELISRFIGAFVNAPARDAQSIAKVSRDRLRDLLDRPAADIARIDLFERPLDLLQ